MNLNDFMQVKVGWDIPNASEPVLSIWNFKCVGATTPQALQVVGSDIVTAFIERYLTPLAAINPTNVSVNKIELRKYGSLTEMYTAAGVLYTGSGGASMLPPFLTYNFELVRFDPSIRNGHISWPGVATSTCTADGKLQPTVRDFINDVGTGWSETEFTVEGPDYVFQHEICRLNAGLLNVPSHSVPVAAYVCNGFGTQNTRK